VGLKHVKVPDALPGSVIALKAELAGEKGLTVAQVAIAYVMNHPMNVFAVVGSSSSGRFRLAVEGAEVRLTQEELSWLELRPQTVKAPESGPGR
jgi:aryl-alcohol dehydrogenase-like predicted oxidoreductase